MVFPGGLKDKLASAASGISDAAAKAADAVRQTPDAVTGVFKAATDAVGTSADAVTGTLKAGVQKVEDGVQKVSDTVQAARTLTANVISTGGNVIGTGGAIAGEVLLISGGFIPFLVFGGLPSKLGSDFIDSINGIAKVVRGDRVQFVGVNHETPDMLVQAAAMIVGFGAGNGTVSAMIYDPSHPHRDSGGIVQLSEEAIVRQLKIMDNSRSAREPAYREALIAVQDAKFYYGIKRDTPLVTEATTFKRDNPAPR